MVRVQAPFATSVGTNGFGQEGSPDFLSLLAEAGVNSNLEASNLDAASAAVSSDTDVAGPGCAAQMAAFFRALSERVDLASFEMRDFVARGAEVLSFGTYSGRLKEADRTVASDWAIQWRVESGRLRMGKAFIDTLGQSPTLAV
jgi:hypothetical protein